jgi:uncharacterized protein (DUF305 family)
MPRALLLTIASLVVVTTGGCGGDEAGVPGASSTRGATSSAVPFDRAFIDAMVPHHQAAIGMARAAKAAGLAQPELAAVADAVIVAQQDEIDRMKTWRAEWFGSATIDPAGAEALGLSEAEMGMAHDSAALVDAPDLESAFAAMMIDHHAGAIAMARLALQKGQHEEIRRLARSIIAAQQHEIAVLKPHAAGDHADH